jgi:hypothetical protein
VFAVSGKNQRESKRPNGALGTVVVSISKLGIAGFSGLIKWPVGEQRVEN